MVAFGDVGCVGDGGVGGEVRSAGAVVKSGAWCCVEVAVSGGFGCVCLSGARSGPKLLCGWWIPWASTAW